MPDSNLTIAQQMEGMQTSIELPTKSGDEGDEKKPEGGNSSDGLDPTNTDSTNADNKKEDKKEESNSKEEDKKEDEGEEIKLDDSTDEAAEATAYKLAEIDEADRTEEQIEFLKKHTDLYDDESESKEDESINTFWKGVVEQTGVTLPEDFKFGNDVDSLVNYTKEVKKSTQAAVDNYIKTNFPRSYAAMLAEGNGEDPSTVFSDNDETKIVNYTLNDDEFKDKDNGNDLLLGKASSILTDLLLYKGLNQDDVVTLIETQKDKGTLLDRAKQELASFKEQHQERLNETIKEKQRIANERTAKVSEFSNKIKTTINDGSIGDFRIADGDKDNFFAFLAEKVVQNNDDFYITSKIDNDNFSQLLQAEYLTFKGGDLNKIATRKLKHKIVMKMRKSNDANSSGNKSTGNANYKTISSLF